jgi:hypothetical protein
MGEELNPPPDGRGTKSPSHREGLGEGYLNQHSFTLITQHTPPLAPPDGRGTQIPLPSGGVRGGQSILWQSQTTNE